MHQAKCLWETRIDPKKTVRPSEHDRPDVAAARVAWHAAAPTWDVAHLVFLDETGITTNLLRRYGRAPRGARVHDHAPCGRWQTSTFLAALRVTGLTAPGVFDGAIDGESFRAYIDQILVPTLHPGDIVIADNLGAHKVAGIQRALQAAGATLWYLPPYSPDLNPIELCFAKLKALVRTARCRSTETLWPFLGECLAHFSPDDFEAAKCRYVKRICPDRTRPSSPASGSLTLRMRSACSQTSAADSTIVAPALRYAESGMALPVPAPLWTNTSWLSIEKAATPDGVMATRLSSSLTSVGMPTRMEHIVTQAARCSMPTHLYLWAFRRESWVTIAAQA